MKQEERSLSAAEQKRKVTFDAVCEEMEREGFARKNLIVSVARANVMAIFVMLPFALIAGLWYYAISPDRNVVLPPGRTVLLLVGFFLLIVVHELIHGLTWGIFAENHFHSISFGVIWSALTPYCTCSEPLKKYQYLLGAAMPTLVLGFVFALVAGWIGNFALFLLAEMMIFGGGGDFYIILKLLRFRSKQQLVLYYDHPYECGVVAFVKKAD